MLLTAISRPVSLHNHPKRLAGTTFSLLQERCSGVSEWPHSGPLGRTQRYAGQSLPTSCRAQQLKATVSAKSRILATPGVLSVSYKVLDISKRSTGMSRVGLAARCQPGTGTSTVYWCNFLLASAPSVHVSISATGTCSRRGPLRLPCQLLQNLGAPGQDFSGHSHTGKCSIYIHKYLTSFYCLHEQRPRVENPELWVALWRESCRAWEGEWNNWTLPSCSLGLSQSKPPIWK